ncbi:putative Smr domain, UBA-like superfamily, Smr domain superfamily protein [Plasmopara halstedii]
MNDIHSVALSAFTESKSCKSRSSPWQIFAMLGSESSADLLTSSSLSSPSSNMLSTLSVSSYNADSIENALDTQVDLVLEMTATFDADGFQLPSKVTRKEVKRALESSDGDVSRAIDEVLNLITIKALSQQDQQTHQKYQQSLHDHAKLQLGELCAGLGLNENSSFVVALQQLSERERDDLLDTNGPFVQQLLLSLEEDNEANGEVEDVHPLQFLLELYPDYKADVVEDVLDSHNYDVDKAAEALHNLRALNHVQSFAAVTSANARFLAQQRDLSEHGLKLDSLGQFPELGASTTYQKTFESKPQKCQQVPHHRPPPEPSYPPMKLSMLPINRQTVGDKTNEGYNVWDYQHTVHNRRESRITTQLKLERLKKLLPRVDSNIIQTTFYLNGGSLNATEAALREVYDLPLVEKQLQPLNAVEHANVAADAEKDLAAVKNHRKFRQNECTEEWTLVSSKNKVIAARDALSNRYCDVLASFRRGQNILAVDRIRELSNARREHRDAQRQWAHDFFLAHEEQIKHQQPIDLHGMHVMEALWVAREAIEYCQEHRIRRCLLICGVGHHSRNGKPRILTALQLSLQRRHIAFRELSGVITAFPLRSTDQA